MKPPDDSKNRPESHGERRNNYRGRSSLGRRVDVSYSRVDGEKLAPGGTTASAVTANIGVGGAFLLGEHCESIGTILNLRIHVPNRKEAIEISAEVRWIRETGERGMGLRFADIAVEALLALREYLSSRL